MKLLNCFVYEGCYGMFLKFQQNNVSSVVLKVRTISANNYLDHKFGAINTIFLQYMFCHYFLKEINDDIRHKRKKTGTIKMKVDIIP